MIKYKPGIEDYTFLKGPLFLPSKISWNNWKLIIAILRFQKKDTTARTGFSAEEETSNHSELQAISCKSTNAISIIQALLSVQQLQKEVTTLRPTKDELRKLAEEELSSRQLSLQKQVWRNL